MPSPRAAGDSASPAIRVEAVPSSGLSTHSRFRGLTWDKKNGGWRVRIAYCGKQRHVGRYPDDVTAAKAYDKAAVYLYGSAAVTNFGLQACLEDPQEVSEWIVKTKRVAQHQAAINRLQRTNPRLQGTHADAGSSSAHAYQQHRQQQRPPPPPPPLPPLPQPPPPGRQHQHQHQPSSEHATATAVSAGGVCWQELTVALQAQASLSRSPQAVAASAGEAHVTTPNSSSACIGYALQGPTAEPNSWQSPLPIHWSSSVTQHPAGPGSGLPGPVWTALAAAGAAGAGGADPVQQQSVLTYALAVSIPGDVPALQQMQPQQWQQQQWQQQQWQQQQQPEAGLHSFMVHTEELGVPLVLSRVGSGGSAGSQMAAGAGMQQQQPQAALDHSARVLPAVLLSPGRQAADVPLQPLPAAAVAAAAVQHVPLMPPQWLRATTALQGAQEEGGTSLAQQGLLACPFLAVPTLAPSHSGTLQAGVLSQQQQPRSSTPF